ncbi:hypothetical protein D3C83_08630 [compost metagenome]
MQVAEAALEADRAITRAEPLLVQAANIGRGLALEPCRQSTAQLFFAAEADGAAARGIRVVGIRLACALIDNRIFISDLAVDLYRAGLRHDHGWGAECACYRNGHQFLLHI